MEKELPKGWVETTLGEIAEWSSGGTPKRGISMYYGGDIPWIKTGDLNNGIVNDVNEFLTEEGIKNSSAKIFPKGSIGIAMYGATIGKTGVLGMDASTNQACAVAMPYLDMNSFLHLFLKSEKQKFIEKGKGGAQPNISQTVIKAHEFPLPPLAEQQRIVAKLDTLFASLENTKCRLEKIPQLLKKFRQAVLTQAVTGKLTQEWRKGKELEEWKELQVSDFMEEVKEKADPNKIDTTNYIGLEHLKNDGGIIKNGISSDVKSNKSVFKIGDVLYGKLRPYLNKHDVTKIEGICSTDILVYRNNNKESCHFFNYYLSTPEFIQKANNESKGINLPRISAKTINQFSILIPLLEEQQEIVQRVESLFAKADAIEKQYTTLKQKIDTLPQALLAKAFKGELVEQLESDGDARELLKEIQKAKESLKSNGKGRKKKIKEEVAMVAEPREEYGKE